MNECIQTSSSHQEAILLLKGHLAISGNIFTCHNWEELMVFTFSWDVAKHSTENSPMTKKYPSHSVNSAEIKKS